MTKLMLLGLTALLLASCGKKEEFKYNLTENNCSTGDQELDSKEALCTRLKDNAANKGCAHSLRKQKFEQDGCGAWAAVATPVITEN